LHNAAKAFTNLGLKSYVPFSQTYSVNIQTFFRVKGIILKGIKVHKEI